MITLYRGDDTGGQLGKEIKIAFHCDDAVDMDGVTVRFNLLNVITKEWTNVHDGDILEMFVTHEQSGRLPIGFLFGKIWGEDSSGKVRTFANRLPIIVTHDLRKVYGSDGLDSQDIHVYSSVDWEAIANKPTLFPSKVELVEGLAEALEGMVKSVNGKTADATGAITLTLDSFANRDGEIQVKQTLMVSRDGGQTFNAVATLVDVWNEIDSHNSSATAHANLMAAIANAYATKTALNSHSNNTNIHVTSDEKAGWDDKYTKVETDEKINQFAAHYLTRRTGTPGHYTYPQFATHAQLAAAKAAHTEEDPQFFYGDDPHTPDKNDYCVILNDETHGGSTTRYSFVGEWPDGYFRYQYTINETAFTQEQWDAINSGITAAILAELAKKSDIPAISTTFTAQDANKAADAKAVGEALAGKLSTSGGDVSDAIYVRNGEYATGIQIDGFTLSWPDGDGVYINLPKKEGTLALTSDITAATKLTPVWSFSNVSEALKAKMPFSMSFNKTSGWWTIKGNDGYDIDHKFGTETDSVVSFTDRDLYSGIIATVVGYRLGTAEDAPILIEATEKTDAQGKKTYELPEPIKAALFADVAFKDSVKEDAPEGSLAKKVYDLEKNPGGDTSTKLDSDAAAVAFAADKAYAVGDYVSYQGRVYRCVTAHDAGAWSADHFTEECLTEPDANLVIDDETNELKVVDAGGKVVWSSKAAAEYDVNEESSETPAADSVQYLELADSTKSLTIPTVGAGKVCDFIVDVHATADCELGIANLANITVMVADGTSLANDITTFKAGEYARLTFTGCAFKVDGKPTYHAAKIVLVNGIPAAEEVTA